MLKDLTDFLVITIDRKEIEAVDINTTLRQLNRLLINEETILKFYERVEIGVNGYDDDLRELWEIPEVNQYIRILDDYFPYWFYFLTKFGSGLKLIGFCCINTQKVSSTKVLLEPSSLERFYEKHFIAMNEIGDRIRMSEQENIQLTEMVLGYFS